MPARRHLCLLAGLFLVLTALGAGHALADDHADGIAAYDLGDFASARAIWQPLAEAGDAQAQFDLGTLYEYGEGVDRDYAEAARWYRLSADQDHPRALFFLGYLYFNGLGVDEDEDRAATLITRAAEADEAEAQEFLAEMYFFGNGVEEDTDAAIAWLTRSAEQGRPSAQTKLGHVLAGDRGPEGGIAEALRWYLVAAERGHGPAQYALYQMIVDGYGAGTTIDDAIAWLKRAAENGYDNAQAELGYRYLYGADVPQDDEEAMASFRAAADQANASGMYGLGLVYAEGHGVEADMVEALDWMALAAAFEDREALRWIRKRAKDGDADAQIALGDLYWIGDGVDQDHVEAVSWYRLAAEQGDAEAQYALGVAHYSSDGAPLDAVEAVDWFHKAAQAGHISAMAAMGDAYLDGEGIDRDDAEAAAWYRKAADAGDAYAQAALGWSYLDGIGSAADEEEAARWFASAVAQNYPAGFIGQSEIAFRRGDHAGALALAEAAMDLAPDDPWVLNTVAWYLATLPGDDLRDGARAIELAERAIALEPDNADAIDTLAAAYAEAGLFEEAIATQERAIELLRASGGGSDIVGFRLHLGAYRRGEPIREPAEDESGPGMPEALRAFRLDNLRGLADEGDVDTAYTLYLMLGTGRLDTPVDIAEGVRWLERAAEAGHLEARKELARRLWEGNGIAQDETRAVALMEALVEADADVVPGDPEGVFQFRLGLAYADGRGVEADPENAYGHMLVAVAAGNGEAYAWYRDRAETGELDAILKFALLLDLPLTPVHDEEQAARWYLQAAERGDLHAQLEMGKRYRAGNGVEKDLDEAYRWYRLAADNGDPFAQDRMGRALTAGEDGVEPDVAAGIEMLRRAAEAGLTQSANQLGYIYDAGRDVDEDDAEAARWYRLAAENGHVRAMYNLGLLYVKGSGVARDYDESFRWFSEAADRGHAEGMTALGSAYQFGHGAPVDYAEAMEWYRKAAAKGDKHAFRNIGLMYLRGDGVERDPDEAGRWLTQAIERGDEHAKYNLAFVHVEHGDYRLAVDASEAALAAAPSDPSRTNALAWWLATIPDDDLRDSARAIELAEKAVELAPANMAYLDTLAAAYAQAGRFDDAIATQERAIAALEAQGKTDMVEDFTTRLDLYRASKPYRIAAPSEKVDAPPKESDVNGRRTVVLKGFGSWFVPRSPFGQVSEAERDAALDLYLEPAERGDADAQTALGWVYLYGSEGIDGYPEARRWFSLAAEQGSAEAWLGLAELAALHFNPESALFSTEKAFELAPDDPVVLNALALKLATMADASLRDGERALTLARKAKALAPSDLFLDETLAAAYAAAGQFDEAVTVQTRAIERASATGDMDSVRILRTNLARYRSGLGLWPSRDEPTGDFLDQMETSELDQLRMMAQMGDADASYALFLATHVAGNAAGEDADEGIRWLELAAESGHVEAKKELARRLWDGDGTEQDAARAVALIRDDLLKPEPWQVTPRAGPAVNLATGDFSIPSRNRGGISRSRAQFRYNVDEDGSLLYRLGLAYAEGRGTAPDREMAHAAMMAAGFSGSDEALAWLIAAANGDSPLSKYALASVYDMGAVRLRDKDKALRWLRAAAEAGHADAQSELAERYRRADGVEKDLAEAAKWYRLAAEQGIAEA